MYDAPNHAGPLENRRPVSAGCVYAIFFRKWLLVIVLVPLVMASIAVAYSLSQPPSMRPSPRCWWAKRNSGGTNWPTPTKTG